MLNKFKNIELSSTVRGMLQFLLLGGLAILTLTAVTFKQRGSVSKLNIQLQENSSIHLIDKQYLKEILVREFGSDLSGVPIEFINTQDIERLFNANAFVRNAEVFVTKNDVLEIQVEERRPVVRIMDEAAGFYLDEHGVSVPLSGLYSARLPVVFLPEESSVFLTAEVRADLVKLMSVIEANAFMKAMVDQVLVSEDMEYEIIPLLGEERIRFGKSDDPKEKIKRLELFYRKKISKGFWSHCEYIDVRFKGQVVCGKSKT